jgi:hypothetical protein
MNIPDLFARDPRQAAAHVYAELFEEFAHRQQLYAPVAPDVAESVGAAAFMFRRAWRAELDDPEPRQTSQGPCQCGTCQPYIDLPPEAKPPMRIESVGPFDGFRRVT